jgi:hypothetical protein
MRSIAVALVGVLALAGGAQAAFDDFDSYSDGQDMFTSGGNGEFSYLMSAPSGNPPDGSETLTAVADAGAVSAPNVLKMADGTEVDGIWAWTARLDPSQAIDLSAPGSTARIEFDFQTQSGCCGGKVSMSWKPLYSVDADAGSEDNIDRPHAAGLQDLGSYFLNNGNTGSFTIYGDPRSDPTLGYQPNEWYHAILDVTRPNGSAGGFDYDLELIPLDPNIPALGTLSFQGAPAAGRDWLTGLGFFSSSNNDETTLFDNLSIVPEPASLVLLGASGFLLARRRG